MWDLPGPRLEPVSPALASGFLTTVPPGEVPHLGFFLGGAGAELGLRCCVWASSSCSEQGLLFVAVHGLLIVVVSLVAEHGLQAHGLQ